MADTTRFDLARLSYGEVLDATKHQDDKIGRLLTAVAFLTAGALVFANRDILASTYAMAGRPYRLTALLLGFFLLIDLAAVVLWLLTVSTPLTFPSGARGEINPSYLFFLVIADTPKKTWEAMWGGGNRSVTDVENDLVDETHNLARRARRKYDQSRVASLIFLASIVFLVPALVLALDTVSRDETPRLQRVHVEVAPASGVTVPMVSVQAPVEARPAPWSEMRRLLVAVPVAAMVALFVISRRGEALSEQRAAGSRDRDPGGLGLLLILAVTQPAFVAACVVANGRRPVLTSGLPVVVAAGLLSSLALWRGLPFRESPLASGFLLGGTLLLTVGGAAAIQLERPEIQLFVALAAACLVLVEVRQRPAIPEVERTADATGQPAAER